MKKNLFLLLSACLLAHAATAQQRRTPSGNTNRPSGSSTGTVGVVKLNMLSLFVRTGSLAYEQVLSDKMSLQLGVQYSLERKARVLGNDILGQDGRLNRFAVAPEFRYYPSGNAPTGFYIGPFVRYALLTVEGQVSQEFNGQQRTINGKLTQNTYSLGCVLGGQWIFGEHFSMDVFGGPYFSGGAVKLSQNLTENDYNLPTSLNFPVWLRAGLSLGYAF